MRRYVLLAANLVIPVAEHHLVTSEDGRVVPMEPDQDSASASVPPCSVIRERFKCGGRICKVS